MTVILMKDYNKKRSQHAGPDSGRNWGAVGVLGETAVLFVVQRKPDLDNGEADVVDDRKVDIGARRASFLSLYI